MHRIHLGPVVETKSLEIGIHPIGEHFPISYLGFVNLTRLKRYPTLQVDVPCSEQALIQVRVKRSDGHIKLGMIGYYLVRRLSLPNKRRDDVILFEPFMPRHVYAGTRINQSLPIYPVGIYGIVSVLAGYRTSADYLGTAVTDIRRLIKSVTTFPDKVGAVLVAGGTGRTLDTAEDDLIADICLLTPVAMDTEVMSVIERSFAIQVTHPVQPYLLGDGCRILAQVPGNVLEG